MIGMIIHRNLLLKFFLCFESLGHCGIKAVLYNKIGDNFSLFLLILFYSFLSFISYYPELSYSIFLMFAIIGWKNINIWWSFHSVIQYYRSWVVLEDIKEGFGINIKSQWDPPTIVIGY